MKGPDPRSPLRLVPIRAWPAAVAELVYAMDSKSIARKGMWVRLPPAASGLLREGGGNPTLGLTERLATLPL